MKPGSTVAVSRLHRRVFDINIPHEQLVALVTIKMRSHEQQKHAIPHEQLYKFYFEFALYFNANIVAQ